MIPWETAADPRYICRAGEHREARGERSTDARRRAMVETKDVLVAGGGIAGLAFALAVRRPPRCAGHRGDPGPAPARPDPAQRRGRGRIAPLPRWARCWEPVAASAQPMVEMVITDSRESDAPRPVYPRLRRRGRARRALRPYGVPARSARAVLAAARGGGRRSPGRARDGFPPGRHGLPSSRRASGALRARLLVAADGGRSRLREAAGIATVGWDYDQVGHRGDAVARDPA